MRQRGLLAALAGADSPYPDMDHRIALTAWRVLVTLDQFDGEHVQALIESCERRFDPEGS